MNDADGFLRHRYSTEEISDGLSSGERNDC
jgi:hypothetical protein